MPVPATPPFRRVLIANRGEIAMRILWAARELGVGTVGVYSDVDVNLPHLAQCDETVHIGAAPAVESYLNIERLIAAARETGCDCVHPGYGFLAENAGAARAFTEAGVTWIGPGADAIEKMGDKIGAKALMTANGVPVIKGFVADLADPAGMRRLGDETGYPLLVKPAAGGGGKGMQVVRSGEELVATLQSTAEQAAKAFGAGGLLIERFLETPRHIEVQVLADHHGTAVHLFERECSIQRRHQKLIEECPSPVLDEDLRGRITAAGVAAAEAAGYTSAGTVEFLYDETSREFFFLEMNTRLQVEHPVTELVTRVDICKAMFRIAAGEKLWFAQSDVTRNGHAIECRIIAEDPYSDFMPAFGPLREFVKPTGPGVRVDAGFDAGVEVSHHYDSLLAKLITWGTDRDEAIVKALHALDEFHILGPQTCIPFHEAMLVDADFRAGHFTVHTAMQKMQSGLLADRAADRDRAMAIAAALEVLNVKPRAASDGNGNGAAPATRDAASTATEADEWRLSGRPGGHPRRWR